jgi:50S ribosome-binding GTPase
MILENYVKIQSKCLQCALLQTMYHVATHVRRLIHFNLLTMYSTRWNHFTTTVILCSLLSQSCRSGLHAIIEAPVFKQENSTTDDHVPGSGERLSPGVLASSRTVDSRVREMLDSTSLAEPAALLPAAVVPALAPASVPETQSLAVVHAVFPSFAGPFTTYSGERVLFSQQGSEWQAILAPGTRLYGPKYILPVVGSGDIGASLAALRGADVWSSRSRIHVLAAPHASPISCVYVGKLGLLGGMPDSKPPTEEWREGPTMILDHNKAGKAVYHIPPGYRYKGYRLKEGSEIQRASLTINYVAANNEGEYRRLESAQDSHAVAAGVGVHVGQVVTLGTLEGSVSHSVFVSDGSHDLQRTTHAGLVLYGNTKENRTFCQESKIDIQVEILVEKVEDLPSPSDSSARGQQQREYEEPKAAEERSELAESLRKAAERSKAEEQPRQAEALRREEELRRAKEQAKATEALLSKKLADSEFVLSDQESIALLTHCVDSGERNAEKIKGKNALIVVGNTGAGKSTFLNYLIGCKLQLEDPAVLGIPVLEDLVVVSPDSGVKEVMPIGHTKQSQTLIPQIEVDRSDANLAYCDCPGFLDNRGVEINIANAVNIRRTLQSAQSARMLILINYHTLRSDRVRGLRDMLLLTRQLFGNTECLRRYQGSLLLGVTQAPATMSLSRLRSFLTKDAPPIMESLAQRTFLYDPLDRGGSDFWDRSQCLDHLGSLQGIPHSESGKLFHTVLTFSDEQRLLEIVDHQGGQMHELLRLGTYPQAARCWRLMHRLCVIDHVSVERMLHESFLELQRMIFERITRLREASAAYSFSEAASQLSSLGLLASEFSEKDLALLGLDMAVLTRYLERYKRKQDEEDAYAARMEKLEDQVASIADQKRMMEDQLSSQRLDFTNEQSRLRAEMGHRDVSHDAQIKKIREEYAVMFRQHEEEAGLQKIWNEEEREYQRAAQARLRVAYEERLSAAYQKKQSVREEYVALLRSQQEAQSRKEAALAAQLATFGQQQNEIQQAVVAARILQSIPAMAIGPKEWIQYFGEVGETPPLPADINQILSGRCPFWPSKKVSDTHLLVLIPATVDGKPFTLDLLGELIKRPKEGGHKTEYRGYADAVQKELGGQSPGRSYWVLMTREVLEGSRDKRYDTQKKLVSDHARRTGFSYELPDVLGAATAILLHHARTGERLYTDRPSTYMRCQEKVAWDQYPITVGNFSSGGLLVDADFFAHSHYYDFGVSCLRKF